MNRSVIINSITYFLILLYLYTGGNKLMDLHLFRQQMLASPILGSVAGVVALVLPCMEILLSILLFLPVTRLKGLYANLILMIIFTVYLSLILIADKNLSCSCGGIVEDLSPKQHFIFNGICIALSLIAISVYKKMDSSQLFRPVSIISTASLFLLTVGLFYTVMTEKGAVKTGMEGRQLPSFNLVLQDNLTTINTKNIPIGKPFIIISFSPYCIHCQQETRDIIQNIDKFNNNRIYMITTFPCNVIKEYDSAFQLSKYPNIIIARDSTNYFLSYLKSTSIPYVAIFDEKKRLLKAIPGRAKIEQITRGLIE